MVSVMSYKNPPICPDLIIKNELHTGRSPLSIEHPYGQINSLHLRAVA
jgi:hypothetical protein